MTVDAITSNPWLQFVSLIIAIASFIAAVIFYKKSRRDKIPYYSVIKQTIIENSTPLLHSLSVNFNGIAQPFITVVKIAFWNHGAETIAIEDIAEAKPLVIVVDEGVNVLNAKVLKSTDDANQFGLGEMHKQEDGSTVIPIIFDFLDQGDGALVQVVHNGDEKTPVWVEGRIKGAKDLLPQNPSVTGQSVYKKTLKMINSRYLMTYINIFYVFMGLLLIIAGCFYQSAIPEIVIGIFFLFIPIVDGFMFVRKGIRKVPKAIKIVGEEGRTPSEIRAPNSAPNSGSGPNSGRTKPAIRK